MRVERLQGSCLLWLWVLVWGEVGRGDGDIGVEIHDAVGMMASVQSMLSKLACGKKKTGDCMTNFHHLLKLPGYSQLPTPTTIHDAQSLLRATYESTYGIIASSSATPAGTRMRVEAVRTKIEQVCAALEQ